MDAWLDAGAAGASFADRQRVYREVQFRLARDLPMLPLWHEDNVILSRRQLQGFEPRPQASLGGLVSAYKLK